MSTVESFRTPHEAAGISEDGPSVSEPVSFSNQEFAKVRPQEARPPLDVPGRPKIKICGVRTPEEALLAAELGADLIGLNFHPPSPRFLEISAAKEIAAALKALPQRPLLVGVFVHHTAAEAAAIGDDVGLDLLQFHGNPEPADIAHLAPRVLLALRIAGQPDPDELAPWRRLGLWGLVLDTRHEKLYGGTGESWDFASIAGLAQPEEKLLIAGGLKNDNIVAAVHAARPWGVDLCSGLESAPGVRNAELLRELFRTLERSFPQS